MALADFLSSCLKFREDLRKLFIFVTLVSGQKIFLVKPRHRKY